MNPLVSVIVPVFNTGKYLLETVKSVREQSYPNIELIVADNGSDDAETLTILKDIANTHQVIYTGKTGVSVARNKAIEASKGSFILPLDSDDLLDSRFIEKCVNVFEKDSSITVVRTNAELFGKKKGFIEFAPYHFSVLLARNLMVVSSMFRKEDWKKAGGFDETFEKGFEDWEFWINLLKNGGLVHTISEPLFKYRVRKGSKNHSLKQADFKIIRKQIWNKHKALYAEYFVDPLETFEYKLVYDSKANKLGNLLLSPLSGLKLMN